MAESAQKVLLGNVLSEASRAQLEAWLISDKVGDKRLRAGLPSSWGVGDKTGSGDHGTANVIAIIRPPGRAPAHRRRLLHRIRRLDGRAQRGPQRDRRDYRGDVLR